MLIKNFLNYFNLIQNLQNVVAYINHTIMKKIVLFYIYIVLITNSAWAYYRRILPYSENPSFITGTMKVWKVPDLILQGGTAINEGFSVEVDFSTPKSFSNADILTIGSSINSSFESALSICDHNGILAVKRKVRLGDVSKDFYYDAWNSSSLTLQTNYVLKIEIDENKFRYSIWETGNEKTKKYEYEFYGLFSSCVKEILTKSSSIFSIAINPIYQIQKVQVQTLGYGIGVKDLPIPITSFWGGIRNVNSSKRMILYNNVPTDGNNIVQSEAWGGSLWQVSPVYQNNRIPDAFNIRLLNIYSGGKLGIKDCAIYDRTPIINTFNDNCSVWQINKSMLRDNSFKLKNIYNGTYAVVENASIEENARVVEYESAITNNGHWKFEKATFSTPLTDGYYYIQNKNSSMFLEAENAQIENGVRIVQYPNSRTFRNVWYVKKEDSGLYTFQNIDTRKDMVVQNASMEENVNIVQWWPNSIGNEKWVIDKQLNTNFYTIKNVNSAKYMVVRSASLLSGEPIIQNSTGEDNKLWNFIPINLNVNKKTGGIYKIKNIFTNLYLVVKDASIEENASIVSWETADTPNGWWSLVPIENGGYALRNVNSQLYLVVKNGALDDNAEIIQYRRDDYNNYGNSLWTLTLDNVTPSSTIFWLKNIHSGKYVFFADGTYQRGVASVQKSGGSPLNQMFRWTLEAVFPY